MKDYIEMNTELRKQAKNDFEKDFFKLMNNSVFGKSMEKVRNIVDVKLIADAKKMEKLKKNPRFMYTKEINNNLSTVMMLKTKCVLDKPIYTGQSILDLSKVFMYEYWYGTIKNKFGDKARLMYTDTDSLIFIVECDDYFKTIDYSKYDISNFVSKVFDSNGDVINPNTNKKRVGIMKSETGDQIINSVVALRPKMYSVLSKDLAVCKAKGIRSYKVKQFTHQQYLDVLNGVESEDIEMNMLRQYNHDIYNITVKKSRYHEMITREIIRGI